MFLKTSHDGEILLDHGASPGIPKSLAEKMNLPPELVGEGKKMTAATMGCAHCGGVVIINPMRKRERANCFQCNQYICDGCDTVRREPDYTHRTMKQIVEMVQSGKWSLAGSMSRPILIPTETFNG